MHTAYGLAIYGLGSQIPQLVLVHIEGCQNAMAVKACLKTVRNYHGYLQQVDTGIPLILSGKSLMILLLYFIAYPHLNYFPREIIN